MTEREIADIKEELSWMRTRLERLTWAVLLLAALTGGGDAIRSMFGG
jgi:hypothetical protein